MDKKEKRLTIRATASEVEAVEAWANRHGLSTAQVVRQALMSLIPDYPISDDLRGVHWMQKRLQSEYGRWLAENDDPQADESFQDFLRWREAQDHE